MSSSARWQGPSHKVSVPFLPGAWPNDSTPEELADDVSRYVQSEDIEAQLLHVPQLVQRQVYQSLQVATSPNIAHLITSYQQIPQPFLRTLVETSSREQTGTPITASISQNSQTTMLTEGTNVSSCPSGILATPDTLSPDNSCSFASFARPVLKDHKKNQFSSFRINTLEADSHYRDRPLIRDGQRSSTDTGNISDPMHRNGLSFDSAPGLPPLVLPPHTLSFSPESIASYFSYSDQDSRLSAYSPSTQPPSSTPASFIVPSPSQEDSLGLSSHPCIATSFYPLLDDTVDDFQEMIFPSASPSTSSFNTDSPILPEEGESPTVSAGCNHGHLDSGREYAPSNAYTFGFSAPAAPDASSAISIPTSFQSAFGSETMSRVESITADWAVQTVHRQYSLASSRSLSSLPVGRDSIRHEDHLSNMREWLRPNPVPSPTFMPLHLSRPAPDPPVLTGALSNSNGGGKSSRFLSLDKLKGLSSRIKALVKGKQGANRIGGTIAVATSIAVTAEEYSSEHPIPLPDSRPSMRRSNAKSPKRNDSERKSEKSKNLRRQSMPANLAPVPVVSNPHPLRPVSFLAMDPSQALHSRHRPPFPAALGRQRSLRASARRKNPSPAPPTLESTEPSIHKDVNPRSLVRWTSSKRERTRTAPEGSFSSPRSNSQRFSLSSPLSKSRLDLLKATILPHPPLPGNRIDMVHEDQPRLSRARNLNDSTDNIFAELDLFDEEHAHRATGENEGRMANSIAQDTADNVDLTVYQDRTIKVEETKTNMTCDTKNTETYSANIPKPKRSRAYSQQGMKTSVYAPLENEAYDSGHGEPKRKPRRSSVSSAISKRALKARSMIIRRPERGISSQDFFAQDRTRQGPHMAALNDNVLPTVQISGEGGRQEDYSIGCADYEPDLVLNPMDFAAISRRASSSGGVAAPTLAHHPFPSLDAGNWMRV